MSIAGLADVVLREPRPRRGDGRRRGGGCATLDLTGPAALRPFVVDGPGRRRAHRAGGHRDRARGRGPGRGARRPARPGTRSPTTRAGRRCRTSGSARAATPSAAGWRCCAGCATRAPTRATARSRSSSRRSARCCSRRSRGSADLEPVELAPGRHAPSSTTSYAGWPTRRTPASTWSRSAASSRCAAASSTSSRRPRSTRCGWSSGATTSRRSAPSRSPTSAPSSTVERLWAPPCRELLLTDDVRRRAAELGARAPAAGRAHRQDRRRASPSRAWSRSRPVLVDEMELLVDLMPADTHVLVLDPERVRTPRPRPGRDQRGVPRRELGRGRRRRHRRRSTSAPRRTASSATSARTRSRPGQAVVDGQPVRPRRPSDAADADDGAACRAGRCRRSPPRPTAATSSGPSPTSAAGSPTATGSSSCTRATARPQRMVEVLGEHDVAARLVDDARRRRPPTRRRHRHLRRASTTASSTTTTGWSLLTGEDLSGQKAVHPRHAQDAGPAQEADRPARAQGRRLRRPRAARRRPLRGDEAARGAGATREYLVLEYGASKRGGPPDRLYVPADALDQVTRYVGGEQPSLDRLGGADWAKRKGRARKAVREIAAELIKLYAARQATKGHAFGPDTPWQRELEDAFPFHETPDQLSTVDEVKADMRAHRADGPAGLRRRRLRQDRDRRARGVQGGAGRQAGRRAGADDAAGAAALRDVRRADERLPGDAQAR